MGDLGLTEGEGSQGSGHPRQAEGPGAHPRKDFDKIELRNVCLKVFYKGFLLNVFN